MAWGMAMGHPWAMQSGGVIPRGCALPPWPLPQGLWRFPNLKSPELLG